MEIQKSFSENKELYSYFIDYIECEKENADSSLSMFISNIENQKIKENRRKLYLLFCLIVHVSNHHYRGTGFFSKIEKILDYLQSSIKQTFSNSELFEIIKTNKRILLYFFENKKLTLDDEIVNYIDSKSDNYYDMYFLNEIQTVIGPEQTERLKKKQLKKDPKFFTNFDEKRRIGANDSYLAVLIQDDLVEDFISQVTKTNISLNSYIEPSIFETNPFLLKHQKTSIIEYSCFYGSIQIFQYLKLNGVELGPSLWNYAIHGNNADIIHALEENKILPENDSYRQCLKKSMKCHHNNIARYIIDNKIGQEPDDVIINYSFRYFNFDFFSEEFNLNSIFLNASLYNYIDIFEILLKNKNIDINKEGNILISKLLFLIAFLYSFCFI